MSRTTSFVLGYHGGEKAALQAIVRGEKGLRKSTAGYHWLGTGRYFWEDDPLRALEWAVGRPASRKLQEPYVIGAAIDLRNCLDLRVRANVELVRRAHQLLREETEQAGLEMPTNQTAPNDQSPDNVMRYLDHAVIERLHTMVAALDQPPFDTVRSLFHEGEKLYADSGFWDKTHTEIAVLNPECILGYFIPRPYPKPPATSLP